MSWRTVVITKTSKLDYSMGYLVVRDVESTAKIHISEISVLIVESTAVSVTAALLNEMIDKTNREGHAAKVYFNALFGKSFSRNDDCPINAALNYRYSIILSLFNREIVASGYVTQLGLFHNNMFNQYNLSCDLMEPFRPFVDTVVKDMNPQKFEKQEKLIIIDKDLCEIIDKK